MALVNLDSMNFIHGLSINRDGTVPAFPRLEGDGKEHAPGSTESPANATSRHHHTRLPFLDGRNRNSTDVALVERNRQKDVGPRAVIASLTHGPVVESGRQDVSTRLEEAIKENDKLADRLAKMEAQARAMKDEKAEMVSEAAVQNQVNRDLKKLLVASMGADLQGQLEHLSTERAQLAQDLENTIATLATERETLERINIQCDVWRSKFLGSRLQVDEVVASRTRLDMVLQEACHALRKILDERDEMRTHMMQTHRLLHYLSNALQRSHRLSEEAKPPTNVLTLALLNEQVASMISKHLLGDVGHHSQPKAGSQFDFVEWTSAEMLAKDIVLNRQAAVTVDRLHTPPSAFSSSSVTPAASGSGAPAASVAQRFHPQTKYENLTINCCKYCLGDIKIV